MLLSSVNRLRLYTGLEGKEHTSFLAGFLTAFSIVVQNHLDRDLELKERTEYFDTELGVREYFPKCYPIASIAEVHSDVTGLFSGGEIAESNFYPGQYNKSIVLWRTLPEYERSLRIKYTGGIAAHPVNSVYTLSGLGSTAFEVDQWVANADESGAGIVKAYDSILNNITIESMFGAFKLGDILTASVDQGGDSIDNTGGTISAIVSQSLVELKPNIALATENEIRYFQKNKDRFETLSTSKDGSTQKRQPTKWDKAFELQDETKLLLADEERIWL